MMAEGIAETPQNTVAESLRSRNSIREEAQDCEDDSINQGGFSKVAFADRRSWPRQKSSREKSNASDGMSTNRSSFSEITLMDRRSWSDINVPLSKAAFRDPRRGPVDDYEDGGNDSLSTVKLSSSDDEMIETASVVSGGWSVASPSPSRVSQISRHILRSISNISRSVLMRAGLTTDNDYEQLSSDEKSRSGTPVSKAKSDLETI